MAESSGFFDAEELVDGGYDREYVAEQWANYFKLFIGNGVFANPANTLKVIAGSGLTVKVLPGWAWINGYWYHNDSELTLEIPTNLTLSTIQDGIFLRFDSANRVISALVGVNRTTVNRVSPYYELKLAEVTVDVGVTSISDANITDTRTDSSVCGIVAGVINQIDTTDLFAQYQAAFNAFMQGTGADFEEWFDHMKDQLDSDAAGHLQAEVDATNEMIAPVQLTLTASQPYAIGEQFIYGGKLYTATSAIAESATITIGTNASLSAEIVKQIKSAKDAIGNLADLDTTKKLSAVVAINEVNTKVSKTEDLISNSGDAYSPSRPYKVGELCIYNNTLYRCTTACSAGSWATNSSCFTQDTLVNVANKNSIKSDIIAISEAVLSNYTAQLPSAFSIDWPNYANKKIISMYIGETNFVNWALWGTPSYTGNGNIQIGIRNYFSETLTLTGNLHILYEDA